MNIQQVSMPQVTRQFSKMYFWTKFMALWSFGLVALSACLGAPGARPTDSPTDQPPVTATALSPTDTPQPTETNEILPAPTKEVSTPASGADADVIFVRAIYDSITAAWTFEVTVSHPDTSWENYADGWDVVSPDGTVLKPDQNSPFTRLLLHPHVGEQPFTRNQRGVVIAPEVSHIIVRAHDIVDGFGGQEIQVDLTVTSGTNFEVIR